MCGLNVIMNKLCWAVASCNNRCLSYSPNSQQVDVILGCVGGESQLGRGGANIIMML